MRQTRIIGLVLVFVTLVCSIQTWAGDTYYKNLSFTVKNPETAKGRVYITPYCDSDTTYCNVSKDPKEGKVEGYLSNNGSNFYVNMFVIPADGYVLDCLTFPNEYESGDYRAKCLMKTVGARKGHPISRSTLLNLDSDTTTNCIKTEPVKNSNAPFASKHELYSIFVPAKKMTVHNTEAGAIASVIKSGIYGESVNDLIVTGPINKSDIKYLRDLSEFGELIRLDLSGASFTTIPDSAFYQSGLYELKLPSSIKAIGNYAFALSKGLKPVKLPSNIVKGENVIRGCSLMELLGIKDETSTDSIESEGAFQRLLLMLL